MDTLIELYDERAIENYLGPETFRPKKVIYVCPPEVMEAHEFEQTARTFLEKRLGPLGTKESVNIEFVESSLYKADKIYLTLKRIIETNKDCVIDVTGGTDAALFAAGRICQELKVAAFTYSRKNNRFYDIYWANFADKVPCDIQYGVSDFFSMTGGCLREGRAKESALKKWSDKFEKFFDIFLAHRREWIDFVSYMTRISQPKNEEAFRLRITGAYTQKGEHGSRIAANERLMQKLENIGFLQNLNISEDKDSPEAVSFIFADEDVRFWLRDVGSVLELYMYKKCQSAGIFQDVVSSAIVDWDGTNTRDSVSNEIDVVAARGVVPLFISCKACDIKTEAINELALLKERFGGKVAKAAIVTTERVTPSARHRAAQLGVTVIDIEELEQKQVEERLKVIMKVRDSL